MSTNNVNTQKYAVLNRFYIYTSFNYKSSVDVYLYLKVLS